MFPDASSLSSSHVPQPDGSKVLHGEKVSNKKHGEVFSEKFSTSSMKCISRMLFSLFPCMTSCRKSVPRKSLLLPGTTLQNAG